MPATQTAPGTHVPARGSSTSLPHTCGPGRVGRTRGPRSVALDPATCMPVAPASACCPWVKSRILCAALRLSRLWRQQDMRRGPRPRLADIYGWFTEGFDAADLQEAKAVLEALA